MNRGEIWLVDLNPGFGKEIHKKRPALLISDSQVTKQTTHAIVVPISSQVPATIGIDMVVVGKKEGLHKKSVVLPLFVRSVDQSRLVKKLGKISKSKMGQVEQALKIILGIEDK